MRRTIIAVTLAALLALAGCAGSTTSGPTATTSDAGGMDSTAGTTADAGRVNFYVSDERNAIDQFEHLNVTITAVGFAKADADAETDDDSDAENETETGTETRLDEDDGSGSTSGIAAKNRSDGWVVRQVDGATVDLTALQGANATLLADFPVPNGTYETAFVYVSDVNATLTSGERVNVKLPSQKLHVNKRFTVGANESVDFVFDITVVEAGNSGKYILKPVVTESGTDVPIEEVRELDEDSEGEGESAADLHAALVGNVTAGSNATVEVTRNGSPVANATVEVNGEVVGQTDADGSLTFQVPAAAEDLEVEIATPGEGEVELERSLASTVEGSVAGVADEDDGDNEDEVGDERGSEGDDGAASDDRDTQTDESDAEDGPAELAAAFTTNVTAGGEATIRVTNGSGAPVENATVEVNGEVVGQTDADGTLAFAVPEDADRVVVEVTKGDAEVTLESDLTASTSV